MALRLALVATAAVGVLAASDDMGPAGFMWPPDRTWSQQVDNIGPCGTVEGASTNRTKFPLRGGRVSLVAQDDSYHAYLSMSFKNDPRTQSDFTYVLNPNGITEIDPGHTCYDIKDPPFNIAAGTNATIQIQYTADFDRPENQTFYACADITYVAAENFNLAQIPCFNATSPDDVPAPTGTGIPDNLPGHGDNEPPLSSGVPSNEGGSNGLGKGAIAGIVVGVVLGVSLIAGLALFWYREKQKRERLERQRDSGRGVAWVEDPPKDSASAGSFRMEGGR
ncbi:hypothetical protein OQA88_6665 [Cercophora sp. LCS_1]